MIKKLHVESHGTQYNTPGTKSSGEEGGEGEEKATIPHTDVIYHFTLNPASTSSSSKKLVTLGGPAPAIDPSGGAVLDVVSCVPRHPRPRRSLNCNDGAVESSTEGPLRVARDGAIAPLGSRLLRVMLMET